MSIRIRRPLIKNPFRALYQEAGLPHDIRRSISMVVLGNICGNLFGVLSSGSALVGYAEALGANDFVFGVLTGLPSAATLVQIPAALLVSRTQQRKRYMLTYGAFGRALWVLIGLVPYFLPASPVWLRLWSVIVLVGAASASSSFINVCFTPWMADLVPIAIRGRWMGLRDGINAAGSVLIGLVSAWVLDHAGGYAGYTIVFVFAGVIGVADMCCFIPVNEVRRPEGTVASFRAVAVKIVRDRPFFMFLLFWTAWSFTANMSGNYLGRYALMEMGLSYTQFTLCSQIASALVTVLVIRAWGKLLDRYGNKPVLWVSCVAASLTQSFYLFSVYGSVAPTLLHNMVGSFFWCASGLAATNLLLSSSPDEYRPSYVAIFSCVTSLLGSFLGALAGGALLEFIGSNWGGAVDRYKILVAAAVTLRFGVVMFFLPRLKNEKGVTVAAMARGLMAGAGKRN
jgi:MFS family permease